MKLKNEVRMDAEKQGHENIGANWMVRWQYHNWSKVDGTTALKEC